MAAEGGTTAMMNWTGTTATSSPAESPTSSTSSSFASSNGMNNLNDSHISDYTSALSAFLAAHPTYPRAQLDALRATDYARLDKTGHVYLDFTGGGLYAESQLKMHFDLLAKSVLGNPHSNNPTSAAATELVESARHAVLEFFEADPEEYTVVFTPNASGALKLVGESYPFGQGSRYLLTGDNHNSNNGIREFARSRGATVTYIDSEAPLMRIRTSTVIDQLNSLSPNSPSLFAYPAQSNFSGVQHPLEWVAAAKARGWDVLLDCAAFVPTNKLSFAEVKPDFVPLSFYKMFGYPTGVGALIVRKASLGKLKRPWFAGGTITIASVKGDDWHHLAPGEAGFEDGTVSYLSLPAISIGLSHLSSIGMDAIHSRVECLTSYLLSSMLSLKHANGSSMCKVFGPRDMEMRGGTVAFYVTDVDGVVFDVGEVERMAGEQVISLRTGCFCNPGSGEVAHDLTHSDLSPFYEANACPISSQQLFQHLSDIKGQSPATIRVSLGLCSNFDDVYTFLGFLLAFKDRKAEEIGEIVVPPLRRKVARTQSADEATLVSPRTASPSKDKDSFGTLGGGGVAWSSEPVLGGVGTDPEAIKLGQPPVGKSGDGTAKKFGLKGLFGLGGKKTVV